MLRKLIEFVFGPPTPPRVRVSPPRMCTTHAMAVHPQKLDRLSCWFCPHDEFVVPEAIHGNYPALLRWCFENGYPLGYSFPTAAWGAIQTGPGLPDDWVCDDHGKFGCPRCISPGQLARDKPAR